MTANERKSNQVNRGSNQPRVNLVTCFWLLLVVLQVAQYTTIPNTTV